MVEDNEQPDDLYEHFGDGALQSIFGTLTQRAIREGNLRFAVLYANARREALEKIYEQQIIPLSTARKILVGYETQIIPELLSPEEADQMQDDIEFAGETVSKLEVQTRKIAREIHFQRIFIGKLEAARARAA